MLDGAGRRDWAVVDQRGKVHGLEGLHVVDASIMPTIPAVPPNTTVIMMAERCSEFLARSSPAAWPDRGGRGAGSAAMTVPPTPRRHTMWDEQFDLVCVGAGAGGLAAAVTAADAGADALVVEKSALLGGVTALSLGQIWLGHNHLAEEAGIEDSVEETSQYLDFLAAGLIDPVRQLAFIEHAREALQSLHRAGLAVEVIRDCPDYYFPRAPGAKSEGRYVEVEPFDLRELGELRERFLVSPHGWGYMSNAEILATGGDVAALGEIINRHIENHEVLSGSGLSGWLVKMAADRGVDMRVHHAARRLVTEDGAVVGVEVETPSGTHTIRAKGVVLATGGYDWNPGMVRSFELLAEIETMAQPEVEGDHIVMATRVGGMIAATPSVANPILLGFHIPGEELDGRPVWHGHAFPGPHTILVNRQGKRFADESFYPSVVSELSRYDRLRNDYPNRPAWMMFDQNLRDKYYLGGVAPGEPLPEGTTVDGGRHRRAGGADRRRPRHARGHRRALQRGVPHGRGRVRPRLVAVGGAQLGRQAPAAEPGPRGARQGAVPRDQDEARRDGHPLGRPEGRHHRARGGCRGRPDPGPLRGGQRRGAARHRRLPERNRERARSDARLPRRAPPLGARATSPMAVHSAQV